MKTYLARNRKLVALGRLLIPVVVIISVFVWINLRSIEKLYQLDTVEFKHGQNLELSELSAEDLEIGLIARITHPEDLFLLTLRSESGLREAASATSLSIPELTVSSALKQYPQQYPGFELLTRRPVTIGSMPAEELVFEFTKVAGITTKARLVSVARTDDQAVYILFQAAADNYEQTERQYLQPLLDSFKFR